MNPLTVGFIMFECERIRYPFREAVRSAAYHADEVLVAVCDEETKASLLELDEPKLRLLDAEWPTAKDGGTERVQQRLATRLLDECKSEWFFYGNADECLAEWSLWSLDVLREERIHYGRALYQHFLGDFDTTFPFIYDRVVRLIRKGAKGQWTNDACSWVVPEGERVADLPVLVNHYGKVSLGREREAAQKEMEFFDLYRNSGTIAEYDPATIALLQERPGWLDYKQQVKRKCELEGKPDESKPFRGRHPQVMQAYMERMTGHVG